MAASSAKRTGVWLVGALGGLGTTVLVGARAIARGRASPTGLVTARSEFESLALVPLADVAFGGHDVRPVTLVQSAWEVQRESGSLGHDLLAALGEDLASIDTQIRPGVSVNCGAAIEQLAPQVRADTRSLRAIVDQLRADLRVFRDTHGFERLIVVNLASTEPLMDLGHPLQSLTALEAALDQDAKTEVRASLLYAYAALQEGAAYINFTPSNAALCPAIQELAGKRQLPFMGSDGKTGETLVKSALAPMFRHRNLQVLSWQGYNILGDRDGRILAQSENKEAKVQSKDRLLGEILGYPLHTHVGIDYVESLEDHKTAWDFIHFRGFLGHKMAMQFIWQGCDAILAAPLVLDLVRLADLALRRGESGPMPYLASFFKSPLGVHEHDLHRQFEMLLAHVERCGADA
ncbi:MAG: inositol-3-phosphate synthase [Planctomycetota bacterium]